jgi:hypothetical protein
MSDAPQKPLPFVYQFAAGAVAGVSEVCVSRFEKPFRCDSLCRKPPQVAPVTNASLPARADLDHVRALCFFPWSHTSFYWKYTWCGVKIGRN